MLELRFECNGVTRAWRLRLGFDAYALLRLGQLTRLSPDETFASNYVFNMAFMRPSMAGELIRTAASAAPWSLTAQALPQR